MTEHAPREERSLSSRPWCCCPRGQIALGPLAWARQWGTRDVLTILDSLENWYHDGHYRPSPLLRRLALAEGTL